jgi:alginate O-acetyltransferase complex protein AlgI
VLFNSLDFVIFFAVFFPLYLALPLRGQNILLLVASYFFYGFWDWRFLSLLLLSTVTDYAMALLIDASDTPRRRKLYVIISMCISLGMLGFFKYFNFFADSLERLFNAVGWSTTGWHLDILLPIGISFYTFQTINYTIDVYRRHMKPTRNFLDFAVFVSYFPHLVAGPIMRASSLLPQIQAPRKITYQDIREGAWLVLFGFYKKTVLADNLAPFVDQVFKAPADAFGLSVPVALLAFAFQIYGDFSGYSDIARGISKFMGIDIVYNFKMPYFATNPSDFWRRWHISLSTWLRDYLYIPLGGSRNGRFMTYRNLALTMLLGGLWHGASWHFVVWGAYHGALLVVYRLWGEIMHGGKEPVASRWTPGRWLRAAGFFVLTCAGWLLFRVNTLADIPVLLRNTCSPFVFNGKVGLLTIAAFALPLVAIEVLQEIKGDMMAVKRLPGIVRLAVYLALFAAILLCGAVEKREFIYFQF